MKVSIGEKRCQTADFVFVLSLLLHQIKVGSSKIPFQFIFNPGRKPDVLSLSLPLVPHGSLVLIITATSNSSSYSVAFAVIAEISVETCSKRLGQLTGS